MRTRLFLMLPLICAPLAFWACGGDSGTSAKDDESSSSSSSVILSGGSAGVEESSSSSSVIPSSSSAVIPSEVEGSSNSAKSSSSVAKSSSSVASGSSSSVAPGSSSDVIPSGGSAGVEGSSSSVASSSSEVVQLIPYTTECPSGKTCTYAPTAQLNPDITYGELLDTRDNQVYKTVTIGTQTWMVQNLNYAYTGVKFKNYAYTSDSTSWCYNDVADSCAKYGRLYTWAAAIDSMALASDGYTCGHDKTCNRLTDKTLAANPIQGVCPSGWHLPSYAEWNTLFTAVGGIRTVSTKLKSTSGWYSDGNGVDSFGFAVLPAGDRYNKGDFRHVDYYAYFWSSTEYHRYDVYSWGFYYYNPRVYDRDDFKDYGLSVRCLRD